MENETRFRNEAHAIPESLGNKSLFMLHECDECNRFFGSDIENHFGNWSLPIRTMERIRGKNGIPTLKSEAKGWRIECDTNGQFNISQSGLESSYEVFLEEKRVKFDLKSPPYIPIAVLKTFVRMGLSILPESEIPNFREAINWVRNPDHKEEIELVAPVHRTFTSGLVQRDWLTVCLLRRKPAIKNVPYMFFVLEFGHETFQLVIPSPQMDIFDGAVPPSIDPFVLATRNGSVELDSDSLDFSSTEMETDMRFSFSMQFESATKIEDQS